MRAWAAGLFIVAVAELAACQRADPQREVEAAVQHHLKQNAHLMPDSFDTRFESVTVSGDAATALVKYESTKVPNLAVQVSYGLKKISGQWQVVSSSPAGGQMTSPANPHENSSMDQAPPPGVSPQPVPSH